MKFLKENWYKLMIGFSMVTFSISALIYTISPAMANNNERKAQFNSINSGYSYFVDGGYVYRMDPSWGYNHNNGWSKYKLP